MLRSILAICVRAALNKPKHVILYSVVRAITMTTLTTCTSFAVLLMTNHAGMELMAKTMLIGLPLCLFASLTLIPAMSLILELRKASQ